MVTRYLIQMMCDSISLQGELGWFPLAAQTHFCPLYIYLWWPLLTKSRPFSTIFEHFSKRISEKLQNKYWFLQKQIGTYWWYMGMYHSTSITDLKYLECQQTLEEFVAILIFHARISVQSKGSEQWESTSTELPFLGTASTPQVPI